MPSLAEVAAQAKGATASVRVPLRGDLMAELEVLERQLLAVRAEDEKHNREPEHPVIGAKILALQQEMADSEVEFVFRAIGRKAYRELLRQHPPTAEQVAAAAEMKLVVQYNDDTFPPALMAAACIEPQPASVEAFQTIWDDWSEGAAALLWRTCIAVNMGSAETPPKSIAASVAVAASNLSFGTASL